MEGIERFDCDQVKTKSEQAGSRQTQQTQSCGEGDPSQPRPLQNQVRVEAQIRRGGRQE